MLMMESCLSDSDGRVMTNSPDRVMSDGDSGSDGDG